MHRSWTVAVVTGAALALAACGGESVTEKLIEEATGVNVDQDGNVVSISTAEGVLEYDDEGNINVVTSDGEQIISGSGDGEVPKDFPSDVPLPELSIASSLANTGDDGQIWVINFSADDPRSAYDTYREQLTSAGYAVDDELVSDAGGIYSALSSASNGTWAVSLIAADGTGLSITVQRRS